MGGKLERKTGGVQREGKNGGRVPPGLVNIAMFEILENTLDLS